jgi:hypothetical protein
MTRRENFSLHYGLQSVVIGVVVNLSVDFVLNNFVFVRLDDLVCDSCDALAKPLGVYCIWRPCRTAEEE